MNKPITAAPGGDGADNAVRHAYLEDGRSRALALGNRGPIRFAADGVLHPDILEAYWRCGFYVFENVLGPDELGDLEADFRAMRGRFPTERDAGVDAEGRPALGVGCATPILLWAKPLSDPVGGTALLNGRHPVKMSEPEPAADAPKEVVYVVLGPLQFSEAALRLYGHPQLLAVAAAINGEDFAPFSEQIFIKEPGRGASTAWHQDGMTHWSSPDWDQGSHGFNFMAQLYGSTPANGVWVVPGSHRMGKLDIVSLAEAAGGDRLAAATPIVCGAGDVAVTNRQALHGAFANTGPDWRVTFNFGFHRRRSVLGASGGGLHGSVAVYDDQRIRERSRLIGYAIDARRRRFPDEAPFVYAPHAGSGESFAWDEAAKATLRDYNLLDLAI